MEQQLSQKKCVACEGFETPFNTAEVAALLPQVPGWGIADDVKSIMKTFTFKNFKSAMDFGNAVAAIAEEEGHHPDLAISWGKVVVTLTTHAIRGLSENDFILAAKVDKIPMI